MTSDVKQKKPYAKGAVTGKKFWKKWGTVKCAVINSDNHVVKRTIASMPGGALPSGTDWNLFLTRLIYNLYIEKMGIQPKKPILTKITMMVTRLTLTKSEVPRQRRRGRARTLITPRMKMTVMGAPAAT